MKVGGTTKETVAVGISGGVDSSVAAYLLQKAGYNVIGIFVKTWSPEWLPCTWLAEKRDAMRVCAALNIPFHFLDASEEYKQEVAEYMIAEYRAGRTPNPDVLCNRVIKFGAMWRFAQSLGATKIATGHYAQTNGTQLLKAVDEAKDQSYFLWMVQQQELAHILFPIGSLPKKEVRAIAQKAGLHTATKKDSQGICFLGDIDMREFLSHYITEQKGIVCTADGTVVGEHDGVWFYTIGERHGFRITEQNIDRKPYYVTGKDVEKNILYVDHNDATIAETTTTQSDAQTVVLRTVNWHQAVAPDTHYQAQIRYHGSLIPVTVLDQQTISLQYKGVLPVGQSVVLYDGEALLGGGVIESAL